MPRKFHDDGELLLRSLPEARKKAASKLQSLIEEKDSERGGKEEEGDDDDSIKTRSKNYLLGRAGKAFKGSAMCFEKGGERRGEGGLVANGRPAAIVRRLPKEQIYLCQKTD